jgi:hypothetical protein
MILLSKCEAFAPIGSEMFGLGIYSGFNETKSVHNGVRMEIRSGRQREAGEIVHYKKAAAVGRLLLGDGSSFRFSEGRYRMEVFAQLLGDRERMMLFSQILEISHEIAAQLAEPDCGLYFDWGPDSSRYLPHVDKRPPLPNEDFLELLNLTRRSKSRSGA